MKKVIVTGISANFSYGKLALTDDQYKAREHLLSPVKGEKGVYEILKPVCFKMGEEVLYDGDIDKNLMLEVEVKDKPKEKVKKPK